MLARGNTQPLGRLLDQLRFGPDMNNDGCVNDHAHNYQNARALGYFVGAVDTAIADNSGTGADTVISDAAALLGVNAPGLVAGTAIQWWAQHAIGVADQKNAAQQSALYEVAISDRSATNGYEIPSAAYRAFQEGYSSVVTPAASTGA